MSEPSSRSLPRRQVLRITATVGASAILGGGLLRAALGRAELHRVRQTRTQMGTLVTITAVHPDAEAAQMMVADTFDEIERLESLLSRHRVGTPVWSLNETGVVRAPPPEVLEVVQKGLDYSALTAGAFDITIAPLLNLYYSLLIQNLGGGGTAGLFAIALQNGFCCTIIAREFLANGPQTASAG